MAVQIARRAFNAGEVDKSFKWRNDVEKHAYACETLENFYVSTLGAANRRKGTYFLGSLGSAEDGANVRLVPFEYNRELSYLLVLRSAHRADYYECESSAFTLPSDFSICFCAPNYSMRLFAKGALSVGIENGAVSVSVGESALASPPSVSSGDKVCVAYSSAAHRFNVYINGNLAAQLQAAFTDTNSIVEVRSKRKGDMNDLKLVGFDMGADYDPQTGVGNAFYTPRQYADSTNEGMYRTLPQGDYMCYRVPFDGIIGATPEYTTSESQMLSDALNAFNAYYNNTFNHAEHFGLFISPDAQLPDSYTNDGNYLCDGNGNRVLAMPTIIQWANGKVKIRPGITWDESHNARIAELYDWLCAFEYVPPDSIAGHTDEEYIESSEKLIEFYKEILFALGGNQAMVDGTRAYFEEDINEDLMNGLTAFALAMRNICGEFMGTDGAVVVNGVGIVDLGSSYVGAYLSLSTYKHPIAYDYIRIPYRKIFTGAQIFFPSEGNGVSVHSSFDGLIDGNIRLWGVAADGTTILPLDGTHTQPIEYILFRVPIGNPNGNPSYEDEMKTRYYSRLLLDKILTWRDNNIVLLDACDTSGNYICRNIDTQIPSSALRQFQYKQAGSNVYAVHSSFKPTLIKFEGDTFSVSDAVRFEPSLDEPEEGVKLSLAGEATGVCNMGQFVELTSNVDFFDISQLDMQLKVEYRDESVSRYEWTHKQIIGNQYEDPTGSTTPWFAVCGEIKVVPQNGIWDGVLVLEESTDGGATWYEIGKSVSIEGGANDAIVREIYDPASLVRVRLKESNYVSTGDGQKIYDWQRGCFFDVKITGSPSVWCKVVAVDSPRRASVQLLTPCRSSFTSTHVYRSSWGGGFEYPRAVEIHEERLALAGTRRNPSTVWLSQTNNWDNFRSVSNLDTDPLAYNLASDDGEPISWLLSREDLMIGTGMSEWSLGSRDAGQALTQSIVKASNQSDDGTEYIMPARIGSMAAYVRRGNREIGVLAYDFAGDSYNSASLTVMNPEILGSGAVSIFNRLSPRNEIFALRADGEIAVFAYDKENNVAAWSRFTFGDGAAAACALSTGLFRSVFLAVRRNGLLCLERLDANESATDNWLDCTPISESMTIPQGLEASVRYTSTIKTTPLFVDGSARVFDVRLYMLDSFGGKLRVAGFNHNGDAENDEWRAVRPRENEIFAAHTPRDYRYTATCDSGYLEEASVEISTDEPAPFNIAAIGIKATRQQ